MAASERRWAVAGLGLVAIAAGLGVRVESWRLAGVGPSWWFEPVPPGGSRGLLEAGRRYQAFQELGLVLASFGLLCCVAALNHWLWKGGRWGDERPMDQGSKPRFVDPD